MFGASNIHVNKKRREETLSELSFRAKDKLIRIANDELGEHSTTKAEKDDMEATTLGVVKQELVSTTLPAPMAERSQSILSQVSATPSSIPVTNTGTSIRARILEGGTQRSRLRQSSATIEV